MTDIVRCTLCGWAAVVSAEDPDATVDDAVLHVARVHGHDDWLASGVLVVDHSPAGPAAGAWPPVVGQ